VPEASDWGLVHKAGEVSPVFDSSDDYTVVQVAAQHAAGPPTRDEMAEQLRQIADVDYRVDAAKARADAVAAAVRGGKSLEDAAKAAGLVASPAQFTRAQPDPRVAGSPELQGALWAAKPGQIVGPIRSPNGWYIGRVEHVTPASDSLYTEALKGQLTSDILGRRQRSFFDGYLAKLRTASQIKDYRAESPN
jgi:peptidyl-prolyl cis-trans isomerase D